MKNTFIVKFLKLIESILGLPVPKHIWVVLKNMVGFDPDL